MQQAVFNNSAKSATFTLEGDSSKYKPDKLEIPEYMVDTPLTRKDLSNYYRNNIYG